MSKTEIETRLQEVSVVPLIQADDPEIAVRTATALVAGGLTVIEVVLRTPEALACLNAIANSVPAAVVGAGTVLSEDHAKAAIDNGAQFVVSPGLYAPLVEFLNSANILALPGVSTASEVQLAWNLGLRTVKFFPASLAGGPPMLKALAAVFADVKFMPTGGISAKNLGEYLALPSVLACGGSWLTPTNMIHNADFDGVTRMAAEALTISKTVRATTK